MWVWKEEKEEEWSVVLKKKLNIYMLKGGKDRGAINVREDRMKVKVHLYNFNKR